jgi:hypothetical protein
MSAALLLALALQGAAGAAAPGPVAEPTMMIVEFTRGAPMIGFPRRCPGSTEEVPPEDEICLAELYQGRVRVVRHLSGPRLGRHGLVRLTAHARHWRPGTRMIVATHPFADQGTTGQFAFWWDLPRDDEDYCVAAGELARWGDGPVSRQFAYGSRRRFWAPYHVEPAEFRCIEG